MKSHFLHRDGTDVHNRDPAATSPENIVTRIRRSCTLFAAFPTPVRRNEVCGTVPQTSRLLGLPSMFHGTTRIFRFHGKCSGCTRKRVHRLIYLYTKKGAVLCTHYEELRDDLSKRKRMIWQEYKIDQRRYD